MGKRQCRDDGFIATAPHYRYRTPYSQQALDWLAETYGLDGRGRLLDVGCGTGNVCLRLSHLFEEVVAVDPSAPMLAEARRVARERGIGNVTFVQARAEDLAGEAGPFRLVTFGQAFHRTDRARVAEAVYSLLELGGALVCLEQSNVWNGALPWHRAVIAVLVRWGLLSPNGPTGELHQEVLARTSFGPPQVVGFRDGHTWTVETLLGNLHAMSFASPAVLGDRCAAFDADIADALLACDASGEYREIVETTVISATKA